MSKRLAPSSSSPNKKPKLSIGQKSLDVFFRSPSKSKDNDRRPAEKLAERDEIDQETTKRSEESWSQDRLKNGNNASDPIDVDVDVDEVLNQGGSKVTVAGASIDKSKIKMPTKYPSPCIPSRSLDITSQVSSTLPNYVPLSVDPMTFDIDGKPPWPPNTPAPYSFLVHTLSTLSQTRSRIQIVNALTNCLRSITLYHPKSLLPSLYLLSNSLSPAYSTIELGLGPSIISKALQQVSGLTPAALSKLYKSLGDPGDVAFAAKSSVRTLIPHPPLSIAGVYDSLLKISRAQGQGAAKQKQSLVERLLVSARGEESRYLVRTLFQNLRVGAVRTTILSALARALVLTPPVVPASQISEIYASFELLKSVNPLPTEGKKKAPPDPARQDVVKMFDNAEALIKRTFVQHPNLDDMVAALLAVGLEGLAENVRLTVGIPLHPTLGSPTRSLDEVYNRLNELPFAAEFKYDGQRAQLHASRNDTGNVTVKIFSRHLEDMTDKYPDVVALTRLLFASDVELSSFIMDAEIVAIDGAGDLKSFQDLSQRARKGVQLEDVKVAVCLFAFDLMYLNGKVLLEEPFRQRRHLLREHFPAVIPDKVAVARLSHVESCESEEGREAVEAFWQMAVEGRSEGLMIKLLDNGETIETEALPSKNGKTRRKPLPATYEPDKRTSAWLKLKKDYVTGLGDSLDVVPIGAWHGNGRKAQWWSPVLLALRDAASGELVAVCKCMSGFSDTFYKSLKVRYPEDSETCSKEPLWKCNTGGFKPSVYFKPQEVWEIRGADITLSPVSVAALGLVPGNRGLSLRFPRFIKVRDDKGLEQASTLDFFADMWRDQESKGKQADSKGIDDGDLVDADWESEVPEEEEDSS